ncbi:hypothetical protein GOARA_016_00160 [Gordonia araii NBRC 100433]|uniref:Uncharacterized protein n=1 Tax=Gordonia araii NBRC 100433 TaxID=1073574 RepID=G7GYN7_9ACTN|nr:hypothetical protein [Gordonia araii]NNG99246.1 hypothetical protein [Gordonia araii NBRC 100433]GAB08712.1 hypothetical protein GOARA_016_00160 [Gordonia araii NBRC 100433]
MTAHLHPLRPSARRLLPLIVLSVIGTTAPSVVAAPSPSSTVAAGSRVAITFVADRRDNGPAAWFDSLGRQREQARTVLSSFSTAQQLWSSTLVYTSQQPVRLTASFTTGGAFARCVITVDDEVRDTRTTVATRGRVTCAP